jgi:hypothetical protein
VPYVVHAYKLMYSGVSHAAQGSAYTIRYACTTYGCDDKYTEICAPLPLLRVRVKTRFVKFPGISGSVFHFFRLFLYYSINMVIDTKTGYNIAKIDRNTVVFSYRPFLDWPVKSGNYLDLSQISCTVHKCFPCTVHLSWDRYLLSFNP